MKKIKYIISALVLSISFSCENGFDEASKSKIRPETVPTYTIFNSATKELMDRTRDEWASGRVMLPIIQYSAQTDYNDEDVYGFRSSNINDLYRDYYFVANDFKNIIDFCINPETRIDMVRYGNLDNQIAASRIMLSYIFSQLVDTFGDVPYYSYGNQMIEANKRDQDFQALNLNSYKNPKYASQKKIYIDILKELKESSQMINTSENVFLRGDNIYGGNANKWKKFANSLRLRIANRVKDVLPEAKAHLDELKSDPSLLISSNDDNAAQNYENTTTGGAPFYTAYFVSGRTDFGISSTFVDLLKGIKGGFPADPRLKKIAAPKGVSIDKIRTNNYLESNNINDYSGMPYAVDRELASTYASTSSLPSSIVLSSTYKEVFIEYSEVQFILSELNNWNQTNYINGVRASMEKWGVSTADIDAYIANIPVANQKNVLTQKYITLFKQPLEAWAEYRRTGFPNDVLLLPGQTGTLSDGKIYIFNTHSTVTSINAITPMTDIPTRLTYPINLSILDAKSYAEAVKNLGTGGDRLTTKLFWDVN